jgi:hypothetical protein
MACLGVTEKAAPNGKHGFDLELEELYNLWLRSLNEPDMLRSSGYRQINSPHFKATIAKGPKAVPFLIAKLRSAPSSDVASFLMTGLRQITRASPVPREKAKGMSTNALARAWVDWFEALDENVSAHFRQKAEEWRHFAEAGEPILWTDTTCYRPGMGELQIRRELREAGKAYQNLLDFGIPILPLLVERLRAGQTCFIPVFEEITKSGAIVHGPNAETTSQNCIAWWERNKEDWVIRNR